MTLEEHNAKVAALKAEYAATVEACKDAETDYNDWFLAFEALSKNGEELQKIRDAAWQSRSDAFDALMDAKEAERMAQALPMDPEEAEWYKPSWVGDSRGYDQARENPPVVVDGVTISAVRSKDGL